MKHKVAIVDDHTLLSQAIGNLVDGFKDFETEGIFKNGLDVIKSLRSQKTEPAIILMDVKMPVMGGIEATNIISGEFPEIKVLALSVEEDERTILSMLRAGAKGYLSKDIKKDVLYRALTETLTEGFYHTQNVSDLLMDNLNADYNPNDLNEKEIEFIQLACSDMTYKEIAEKMCVSPKTVDNYREASFKKLGAKNRVGMVLTALKNKIFKID